ncbi:unnamed protein product [Caenorhabditis brenneri]
MANEMRVFLMTKQGKEVQEKQERKQDLLNDARAFYQDHFVSVRPDCLVVKKFFIPSSLPYEFPWEKIESLTYNPQNKEEKVPGRGLDKDGRWWACDVLRPHERELHLYNVRVDAVDVEPQKSGFTVIYIDQFLKACRHLLPYSCKLSGCVWSE